jgi:hypothetical protein
MLPETTESPSLPRRVTHRQQPPQQHQSDGLFIAPGHAQTTSGGRPLLGFIVIIGAAAASICIALGVTSGARVLLSLLQ